MYPCNPALLASAALSGQRRSTRFGAVLVSTEDALMGDGGK